MMAFIMVVASFFELYPTLEHDSRIYYCALDSFVFVKIYSMGVAMDDCIWLSFSGLGNSAGQALHFMNLMALALEM